MATTNSHILPYISQWGDVIPKDLIDSFDPDKTDAPPVIFIGSGFGKEAIPPLKTGGELSEILRQELDLDDNGENLSELLQYYQNELAGSKRVLTDWLKKQLLHGNSRPGGAYRLLLELPCHILLTTNYDTLIMDANQEAGYKLTIIDDPSSFESSYSDITSVSKKDMFGRKILGRLHGAFEFQDNIVATTDDYINRYTNHDERWKDILENIFRTRRVVFIGYSLKDFTTWTSFINVFTQWKNAVFPYALVSPSKSKYYSSFWERYRVKYIGLSAHQFLMALHDKLGLLETKLNVATAAVAACHKQTFKEASEEIKMQQIKYAFKSPLMTATKILMDECHEN